MDNYQLKMDVETTTGKMCIDCKNINVRKELKGTSVS
jgi:hypothetical protein